MSSSLTFGPFTLDPRGKLLFCDGQAVPLGARAAALLQTLLDAKGDPVTKSDLMDHAWPGLAVEESNLAVQIAALRKVLGVRSDGADWIGTVPRVGYRLFRGMASPTEEADPLGGLPALAVLPFTNLSADPDQAYFADGVVDDLITALSRFRSFAVIARNSSFTYRGRAVDVRRIGEELGVRYVLEGSVRRAGNRLRINAQLVDAETGSHLWAQNFDGGVEDIFAVQDEITNGVVAVVGPMIRQAEIERSRIERPESLAAHDLYLRALQQVEKRREPDNVRGLDLLERAIVLDPRNATILATAAMGYEHRVTVGWPSLSADDRARSLELAEAALAIRRDDPSVLSLTGLVFILVGNEHDKGLQLLNLAVTANPNDVQVLTNAGVAHIMGGDLDEAVSHFQKVIRLNPWDSVTAHIGCGHVEMCRGNYEQALDWGSRALAMNSHFAPAHWIYIAANAQLGRMDAAREAVAAYRATTPNTTLATIRNGVRPKYPERVEVLYEGMRASGMPEN
jgi:TolB-like protein